MQIMPRVAADPKAVPIRKEIRQQRRKVMRIKTEGTIIREE